MSLPEGLAQLVARRRFGVDLGLARMERLVEALGDPLGDIPVVHLAGTNGKGSTAALLDAALRSAGLRCGLYTSPHLQRFNERVRVDGVPIADDDLAERLAEVLALDGQATFFEVATALAFAHFGRQDLDVCVVETGLGGRLDATNVVSPRLTVLTPIANDHGAVLGDTLEAIAGEKVGILAEGTACVSASPSTPEVAAVVLRAAEARDAPLWLEGRDFRGVFDEGAEEPLLQVEGPWGISPTLEVGLAGRYQLQNASVAWAALEALAGRGFDPRRGAWAAGFAAARWPGRCERRGAMVLDCAHNVAGCEALVASLPPGGHTLVFAALADKEVECMLSVLRPRVTAALFPRLESDRAVAAEALASSWGAGGRAFSSVAEALSAAAAIGAPVIVAGSAYLIGEARAALVGGAAPDAGDPVASSGEKRN